MSGDLYRGSRCVYRGVRVTFMNGGDEPVVFGTMERSGEKFEPGVYELRLYDGMALDIRVYQTATQGDPQSTASAAFKGEVVKT